MLNTEYQKPNTDYRSEYDRQDKAGQGEARSEPARARVHWGSGARLEVENKWLSLLVLHFTLGLG